MSSLAFERDGAAQVARLPGPWLRTLALVRVEETFETRTPAGEESLVLVLAGTLDLFAGGSSWLQRGLRATVFEGRPCGVYVPPNIGFRAVGHGELLLVNGQRPPLQGPASAATGGKQAAPAARPLLPLTGGKAYDARTGTWELLERFPSSPEAVLPRAIETTRVGEVRVERVFGFAFKAQTLCLDECVVHEGQSVILPRPIAPPGVTYGDELALLVRSEGEAEVEQGDAQGCTSDRAFALRVDAEVEVRAIRGRAYVAAAWAGPKP